MPITQVSPTSPVTVLAQGTDAAAPGLVLQPGTVVTAKVLGVLADNWVQISIANLSLEVMSEVALTQGQTLQLAVSRSDGGIRLAIVGPGSSATIGAPSDTIAFSPDAAAPAGEAVTIAPGANIAVVHNALTPLEQIAVATASQAAAIRQGSQAPLFANLAAAAGGSLPPALQEAVAQVLARQTPLDQSLGGADIRDAFQRSGLFLEASLAAGAPPGSAGVPDLKAALIVLRQALATTLAGQPASPPVTSQSGIQGAATGVSNVASSAAPLLEGKGPPLAPEIEVAALAQQLASARAAGPSGLLALVQEVANNLPRALSEAMPGQPQAAPQIPRAAGPARPDYLAAQDARNLAPAPPFRGALPSAQAVAAPSIVPGAELPAAARQLLDNTDAAIARQTLLQAASLPDRTEASSHRLDSSAPQWHFEIPFATAQGTAMAQFAISRDGGDSEADPVKRVWRVRFSLDVEPAGPVHALIAFSGETTSVRMWAERPATAAQLRAGAGELSQALVRAELKPGDIVVRDGAPPQPAPPQAGHFLDRAL